MTVNNISQFNSFKMPQSSVFSNFNMPNIQALQQSTPTPQGNFAPSQSLQNSSLTDQKSPDDEAFGKKAKKFLKQYGLEIGIIIGSLLVFAAILLRRRSAGAAFTPSERAAQAIPPKAESVPPPTGTIPPKSPPPANSGAATETNSSSKPHINPDLIWKEKSSKATVYMDDIQPYFGSTTYKAVSTDTNEELLSWFQKRAAANQISQDKFQSDVNIDFSDFEITPHSYQDDTLITIVAKCCGYEQEGTSPCRDWQYHTFLPNSGDTVRSDSTGLRRVKAWVQHKFGYTAEDRNPGRLVAAADDKGKKILFFDLRTVNPLISGDSRSCGELVLLKSNDNNFTQLQKDLIKIFSDPANKKYVSGEKVSPLQVSYSYMDFDAIPVHNKTAFLSAIHSWAQHSSGANYDKVMEIQNQKGFLDLVLNTG